jgi:4-hydroxy 2-oxovalerate aldolase
MNLFPSGKLKSLKNNFKFLDCTLRDGSYVINFNFTKSDTKNIVAALDEVGVEFIEVGHGIGLGASTNKFPKAAATDEEYMQSASENCSKSNWGMFFIPGIGTESDILKAGKYKMNFIRIGVNIEDYKITERYINLAKEQSMYVAVNFMKSYAATPNTFLKASRFVSKVGADLVYIVDSAGGMLPHELNRYIQILKKNSKIKFGFHGHDNLSLSNYNSLLSISEGAKIVDISLQGLGRSAGNASFETLIFLLMRYGFKLKIDPLKLLKISEKYIIPLINNPGKSKSLDIISGYSQFHSSYMPIIDEVSNKFKLDPKELIIFVSKKEKSKVTKALVEKIAINLKKMKKKSIIQNNYNFKRYAVNEQGS